MGLLRFIQKNAWQELCVLKMEEQAAEKAAHIHIVHFCDTICHNHIFGVETKIKDDLEMLFYILVIVMFND